MKRFTFYQQRNGECIRVTPELVKQIIRSEFNVKQTQKKNKEKAYWFIYHRKPCNISPNYSVCDD